MENFVLQCRHDGKVAHRIELSAEWGAYAGELGRTLARIRHERGLSQERVAAMAGISSTQYQKYEKGQSRPGGPMNPTLVNLIALSQALGVTVAELLPPSPPDLTMGA